MTTPAGWAPCSDQSRRRADPMYGTASAGAMWLLVEVPGAWGNSAFLDSPSIIDRSLGLAIVRRAESAGLRIAAIRRHGRRQKVPRWRWFIARSVVGEEALHHGEVARPEDYLDLALDGSDGDRIDDPLVIVCAHGRHDQCCAVRGRGAVASIAAQHPEITWECSHLGGDRFAATMLILPHGLCYGRVDETDPARLVSLYLAGRLDDSHLRGRTSVSHEVQAAQHYVRQESGEDGIDGLAPVSVEPLDGGQVRVVLQGEHDTVAVVIAQQWSEPLLSQCSATIAGRVRTFELVSVTHG